MSQEKDSIPTTCHHEDPKLCEFDELVCRLLLEDRVPARRLVARIEQAAVNLSKQFPPILLMYNITHGGYGLSRAFVKYCCGLHKSVNDENDVKYDDYNKDDYEDDYDDESCFRNMDHNVYDALRTFAMTILERYKSLDRVLAVYYMYACNYAIAAVQDRLIRVKKHDGYVSKRDYATSVLLKKTVTEFSGNSGDSKEEEITETTEDRIKYDSVSQYEKYSPACLEETIRHLDRLIESISSSLKEYPPEMLKHMRSVLSRFLVLEVSDSPAEVIIRDSPAEDILDTRIAWTLAQAEAFLQLPSSAPCEGVFLETKFEAFADILIKSKGQNLAWQTQHFFSKEHIEFAVYILSQISEAAESAESTDPTTNSAVLTLSGFLKANPTITFEHREGYYKTTQQSPLLIVGRMLASSRYCKLAIAEVPALSNWRITEYDGLESIVYYRM